jgi:hypothetical protein
MKLRASITVLITLSLFTGCSVPITQSTLPHGNLNNKIIYALPKGMIRISFYREKDQDVFLIEPIFVPDPLHYYALEACSNIAYDDEVQISVDTNGLLKAINVTSTSRVGEIGLQLVEIAKQAAKIATTRTTTQKYFDISLELNQIPEDAPSLEQDSKAIKELSLAIDVADQLIEQYKAEYDQAKKKGEKDKKAGLIKIKEEDKLKKERALNALRNNVDRNNKLSKFRKRYKEFGLHYISLNWLDNNIEGGKVEDTPAPTSYSHSNHFRSVYYKPLLPCKLKVIFNDNLYEKIIYLPKPDSPIIAWDIKRPAFVQKITKLTFANGVLTEVYLNKPSELLAGLKIPAEILKAVAGMPLELLQFRVSQDKASTELLQGQVDQIRLRQQLLELQQSGK